MSDYLNEVQKQIDRNSSAGGWGRGPAAIIAEAAEETVDVAAWLRGLDGYPMTAEQLALIDEINQASAILYVKLRRLKATYE